MRGLVALACVWAIACLATPAMGVADDEPFTGSVARIDRDTRRLMVGS